MDVRCERCRAQYVFDDEQVTPAGLTVQCTNCGHLFKVKKKELIVTVPVKPDEMEGKSALPATAAAPRARAPSSGPERPKEKEWRVRQANGNLFTFRELTTLQKWIVEQKVSRDDEISLSGDQWKRLGNIAELASFFLVTEAAEKARGQAAAQASAPAVTPLPMAPVYGVPVQTPMFPPPYSPTAYPPSPPAAQPAPGPDGAGPYGAELGEARRAGPSEPVDLGEGDLRSTGRRRRQAALAVLLLLVATGAGAYVFKPEWMGLRPKPPPPVAVPITIEVKPPEAEAAAVPPAAGAGETPTPVPTPEPVGEAALPRSPEPVAKPEQKAAPAPRPKGVKALMAQAAKLRDKGDTERALDLYGRAVDEEPDNAAALAGRGLCYLDLSRYPPAEASFQAALQIDARQPDALLGLAETYRWQGKKAEAIKYYERYLTLHPDGDEAEVARNAMTQLKE